jgi:hypothetical protein
MRKMESAEVRVISIDSPFSIFIAILIVEMGEGRARLSPLSQYTKLNTDG